MERRYTSSSLEMRNTNEELVIAGYFSMFNSVYQITDHISESVANTAFDGTLNDDIRCLIDHETRLVIGRTVAGTLKLRIDEKGLYGEVVINPKDTDALNLYERVKRGDINQCSFGFDILDEEYSYNETTDSVHYTIKKVKLYEVSIVTFPAYQDTSVNARKEEFDKMKKRTVDSFKLSMMKKLNGGKN